MESSDINDKNNPQNKNRTASRRGVRHASILRLSSRVKRLRISGGTVTIRSNESHDFSFSIFPMKGNPKKKYENKGIIRTVLKQFDFKETFFNWNSESWVWISSYQMKLT